VGVGAGAGALISYTVKVASTHGDFAKAWDAYWQTSPWGIMTFATAYGLAFLADDEPQDGFMGLLAADRLRWVEGLGLTIMLALTASLVHSLLLGTQQTAVRPLAQIEVLTVVIGFSIGSLVPSWYRHAPREAHSQGRLPVVAASASVGQP